MVPYESKSTVVLEGVGVEPLRVTGTRRTLMPASKDQLREQPTHFHSKHQAPEFLPTTEHFQEVVPSITSLPKLPSTTNFFHKGYQPSYMYAPSPPSVFQAQDFKGTSFIPPITPVSLLYPETSHFKSYYPISDTSYSHALSSIASIYQYNRKNSVERFRSCIPTSHTFIGEENIIGFNTIARENRILSERTVEHEVKVPKKVIREEVIEKVRDNMLS